MKVYRYLALTDTFKVPDKTMIRYFDFATNNSNYMSKADIKKEIKNKHMNFINAEVDADGILHYRDKSEDMAKELKESLESVLQRVENKLGKLEHSKISSDSLTDILGGNLEEFGGILAQSLVELGHYGSDNYWMHLALAVTYFGYGIIVETNDNTIDKWDIARKDDLESMAYNAIMKVLNQRNNLSGVVKGMKSYSSKQGSTFAERKYDSSFSRCLKELGFESDSDGFTYHEYMMSNNGRKELFGRVYVWDAGLNKLSIELWVKNGSKKTAVIDFTIPSDDIPLSEVRNIIRNSPIYSAVETLKRKKKEYVNS